MKNHKSAGHPAKEFAVQVMVAFALAGMVIPSVAFTADGTNGSSGPALLDYDTDQLFDSQDPPHTIEAQIGTATQTLTLTGHSTGTFTGIGTGNLVGTLTSNYIPRANGPSSLENSGIYEDATGVAIGTASTYGKLRIVNGYGDASFYPSDTGLGWMLYFNGLYGENFSVNGVTFGGTELATALGINYAVNGATGVQQYCVLGAKYCPYFRLNAEDGSLSLFGENGSGGDWRNAAPQLGLHVTGAGLVGVGMVPTVASLEVSGNVKSSGNQAVINGGSFGSGTDTATSTSLLGTDTLTINVTGSGGTLIANPYIELQYGTSTQTYSSVDVANDPIISYNINAALAQISTDPTPYSDKAQNLGASDTRWNVGYIDQVIGTANKIAIDGGYITVGTSTVTATQTNLLTNTVVLHVTGGTHTHVVALPNATKTFSSTQTLTVTETDVSTTTPASGKIPRAGAGYTIDSGWVPWEAIVAHGLVSTSNGSYDVGGSSNKWKDGYFSGTVNADTFSGGNTFQNWVQETGPDPGVLYCGAGGGSCVDAGGGTWANVLTYSYLYWPDARITVTANATMQWTGTASPQGPCSLRIAKDGTQIGAYVSQTAFAQNVLSSATVTAAADVSAGSHSITLDIYVAGADTYHQCSIAQNMANMVISVHLQ